MSNDTISFGELIDQEIYKLADMFKQHIPPKDFDKLIPAINEAQTILQLEYNKIKKACEEQR